MWNKEDTLVIQLILGVIETSANMDKYNIWLLAGTGATASLIVSNVSNIVLATEPHTVTWMLSLLAISTLFGLLAKINGTKAESSKTMFQTIFSVLEQHKDTNLKVVIKTYQSVFPFWVRRAVRKGAENGAIDPLFGFKLALRFALYQSLYTMLQCLFLVGFITLVAFSLK
jgi:hypothetical protein